MNKDRQFMNTRIRFAWNGHSYGVVRNPWDAPKDTVKQRDRSPDLLPSVFKDQK